MRFNVPVLFVDHVLTFIMLSTIPCTSSIYVLYVLWVINTRNNSCGRFRVRFRGRLSPSEVQPKPPRPLKQLTEFPALHNLCSLDLVS